MTPNEGIAKRVRAALENERRINLHRHPLEVSVADEAVVLDGEVDSIAAKKLALEIAGSERETRGVVDRVRVAVPERRGDGAIRTALADALLAEPELLTSAIRVRAKGRVDTLRDARGEWTGDVEIAVDDGVVTLDGHVISLSHKRLAGVIAWWTPGCRDVVNSLDVVPGEDDNDAEVVEALRIVLEVDPTIASDQVTASCSNYRVTLDGLVPTEEERRRVELDAWALFGVDDVVNRIQVGGAV